MSGDDCHCIPGLTIPSSDGNFSAEQSGIIETMHTGFSAYTYALCQRPGADTEETDVMIEVERFV